MMEIVSMVSGLPPSVVLSADWLTGVSPCVRLSPLLADLEHMRTCVRMSIKGRPYTWFRSALRRGDLIGVRAAAAELGHKVNLVDALGVVLLMAARDDDAFDRAATKWLARFALERPAAGLDDLRLGLSALEALPYNGDAARLTLAELCARHRLDDVVGLLA